MCLAGDTVLGLAFQAFLLVGTLVLLKTYVKICLAEIVFLDRVCVRRLGLYLLTGKTCFSVIQQQVFF